MFGFDTNCIHADQIKNFDEEHYGYDTSLAAPISVSTTFLQETDRDENVVNPYIYSRLQHPTV
eukprot:Pgem_evm1s3006